MIKYIIKYYDKKSFLLVFTLTTILGFYANLGYLTNDAHQDIHHLDPDESSFFRSMKENEMDIANFLKPRFFPPYVEGMNLLCNHCAAFEYFYIGKSIALGKGFSSPFQVETGPTAWMPPLVPYLISGLYLIFEDKIIISYILTTLKIIALSLSFALIAGIFKEYFDSFASYWYFFSTLCLFYLAFFYHHFQVIHEVWLPLFLLTHLIPVFLHQDQIKEIKYVHQKLGLILGLAALINPIISFSVALSFYLFELIKFRFKNFIKMFLFSALIFSPWIIRNALVLGEPYIIKSNFYYDAQIINYENPDGINQAHLNKDHLYFTVPNNPQHPYIRLGEKKYLENYKTRFKNSLIENPKQMLTNILNRTTAAFLIYSPFWSDGIEIMYKGELRKFEAPFLLRMIQYSVHFAVSAAILYLLFLIKRRQLERKERVFFTQMVSLYFLFHFPYLLITYYERYVFPLNGLKFLFLIMAVGYFLAPENGDLDTNNCQKS